MPIPPGEMGVHSPEDLQRIYGARFGRNLEYRKAVWSVLVSDLFARYIDPGSTILDLGCGYGEFINQVRGREKYAMDLNPDASRFLAANVRLLLHDCAQPWPLADASLDVVFTSNFFEHLPDKIALGRALDEVARCLRRGGRLIALGPNVKYLPGAYWDFWDHHIALTEASLCEALTTRGFTIPVCIDRFLPYTMASGREYPVALLRAYLKLPFAWRLFGKQFLVVAARPS